MAERPPDCGRTGARRDRLGTATERTGPAHARAGRFQASRRNYRERAALTSHPRIAGAVHAITGREPDGERGVRSEEHTSELQSLMRNSYAVLCLKKKKT